jgi:SulP family sulfate permease
LDVATIGNRFGGIQQSLPSLHFPAFEWGALHDVISSTVTIALLGAIESLLCARVADSIMGDRHDPNQELMAQGVANFAAPLFGGFCATGTVARTVANIRSGAVSPIAGIVHSATLLLIVLVAAPLAENIPLATLSAILMFVAYNMGEWDGFIHMMRFTNNYRAILVSTFVLTVIIDLTVAVEAGLAMACIFFITRVSSLTNLEAVSEQEEHWMGLPLETVEVFRLHGSLFFGSISKIEGLLDPGRPVRPITLLDMSDVLNIDTTGLDALKTLHDMVSKKGGTLVLCGLDKQPASIVHRSGFDAQLGPHHIFKTIEDARDHIEDTLSAPSPRPSTHS